MGNCNLFQKMSTPINSELPSIFSADITNIHRHSYEGHYKYAVFDHIYDGDTADVFFMDGEKIIREPFRFYGYDSAEIKPLRSEHDRDAIINQARADKDFLSSLLRGSRLIVHFAANEKYGRMMGKVWKVTDVSVPEIQLSQHPELIDDNQINLIMIKSGHGNSYFGGKK